MFNKNIILKTILTVVMFIFLTAVYYFLYSLPNHNKLIYELEKMQTEEELKLKMEKQKKDIELAEQEIKIKEAEERRLQEQVDSMTNQELSKAKNLENCLDNANSNYIDRWADTCQKMTDKYFAEYQNMCLTTQQMIDNKGSIYCDEIKKWLSWSPKCELPSVEASSLNISLENSKKECVLLYK